jgi:hypothetical protein
MYRSRWNPRPPLEARHLDRLRHALSRLILPARWTDRQHPLAVKRKMSN